MAIQEAAFVEVGQVGVTPRTLKILSTDSYATITTAGYLDDWNRMYGPIKATDLVIISYASNQLDFFSPSINVSTGVITLVPINANNALTFSGEWVSGEVLKTSATTNQLERASITADRVMQAGFDTPDVNANIIRFDTIVDQADLAAGGNEILLAGDGTKTYKILGLWLNSGGTNFSGGGGDRLGQITDGTTVYSVIPAATMQSLANATWGDTALPFPASAPINQSTVAAQNLRFSYSGGTTDYTAGQLTISGCAIRIT